MVGSGEIAHVAGLLVGCCTYTAPVCACPPACSPALRSRVGCLAAIRCIGAQTPFSLRLCLRLHCASAPLIDSVLADSAIHSSCAPHRVWPCIAVEVMDWLAGVELHCILSAVTCTSASTIGLDGCVVDVWFVWVSAAASCLVLTALSFWLFVMSEAFAIFLCSVFAKYALVRLFVVDQLILFEDFFFDLLVLLKY